MPSLFAVVVVAVAAFASVARAFQPARGVVGVGAPRVRHFTLSPVRSDIVSGAECVEEESCSVEELQALLAEVKTKAAEIKDLETRLTALNKDDSSTLKQMLAAEECELNGFDGCSAWYYDK